MEEINEKKEVEIQEDNNKSSSGEFSKLVSNIPRHNWALASYVLGFVCIVLLIFSLTGNLTGRAIDEVPSSQIRQQMITLLEDADTISVKEVSGLYEVSVSFEGQIIPFYVTKDGKLAGYGSPLMPLKELIEMQEESTSQPAQTTQTQQSSTTYSDKDLFEVIKFNECLAEKGFVIYGAEWCGYCQQLVTLLGGYEAIESVYIECVDDKNKALCSEKLGGGYPTIRINDELYSGARTFEAFSQATGCPVPNLG